MPEGVDDRVWRKLRKEVDQLAKRRVKVGILQSKGGGEPTESGGATMVDIGTIHEFGAPKAGIPERSFLRRTFREKKRDLAKITTQLSKKVVTGKLTHKRALEILGAWGAAQVQKRITSEGHIPPPLKPRTVARKGSDRPLVDTGRLVQSISWEVDKEQ